MLRLQLREHRQKGCARELHQSLSKIRSDAMSIFRWLKAQQITSSRRPTKRTGKPRRGYRPGVECLENRLAPATLTVNSLADNTTDTSHLTLRDAITLVNHSGDPSTLGQSTMPAGWAGQIGGCCQSIGHGACWISNRLKTR